MSVAKKRVKAKPKAVKKPARKAPVKKTARKIVPKKSAAKKKAVVKLAPKQAGKNDNSISGQLLRAALKVLSDRQASEVATFDLAGRSSMADYLVIASGRAGRQVAAIADYLREAFMKLGARNIRIEGLPEANWVLVDAGDVIVHLFRPEVRAYYRLDEIWAKR